MANASFGRTPYGPKCTAQKPLTADTRTTMNGDRLARSQPAYRRVDESLETRPVNQHTAIRNRNGHPLHIRSFTQCAFLPKTRVHRLVRLEYETTMPIPARFQPDSTKGEEATVS
jgi:hypothetical protein